MPGTADPSRPPARRGRPPSGGKEAILAAALDLLRERGASRLTTREVAQRAGVAEGSVFYHFTDRAGLLTAVIENGLLSLQDLRAQTVSGSDVRESLGHFATTLERFLDEAFVVMVAAQSDAELRTALSGFITTRQLGPQRGVEALGQYLRAQQSEGAIRADVDPARVAFLVLGACFLRVGQRQMIGPASGANLPGLDELIECLYTLLAPPDR